MAFDEKLAARVDDLIGEEPGVDQKKMFGGLAFLVGGHMGVAVSGAGGLMVRTDPSDTDRLLAEDGVVQVEMRGRPMRGWIRVPPAGLATKRELRRWVSIGMDYAATFPPK